jgi:cholera toxin transcriptional activator
MVNSSGFRVRFGVFEFDLRSEELRKQGRRVRVSGQPAQIHGFLLPRPGELVTREELQQALWPADTHVNFEQSLNAAVKRLRQALGDSPEKPLFIETMARRGYRFNTDPRLDSLRAGLRFQQFLRRVGFGIQAAGA